jgi:divalent metal cation (Fe/Co/Zn/Cd) transporter
MSITLANPAPARAVLTLQALTLGWMLIECCAALAAALHSHSVSLLAFGSDSLVELLSAATVLLQWSPRVRLAPSQATRFCGLLLYALAAVVTVLAIAGLLLHEQPESSRLGIAVTVGALLLMPMLAYKKRRLAHKTGNGALRADAVQSATCAYLAALTLSGLCLRALFGVPWLDPIAALCTVPLLLVEGRRARRGIACSCC